MANDLTTALLSGSAGNMAAADPQLLAVAPQMSLAQAMMQSSLSGAPAYPAQAIGRLAQTLSGINLMDQTTGQLQDLYKNGVEAASRALPPDHPLQKFLQSPDPFTRSIGLRNFDKALIQQTGAYSEGYGASQKAPYEGGGEGTVFNPQTGRYEKIPLTAATRGRMQPGGDLSPAEPEARPVSPAGRVPVIPPAVLNQQPPAGFVNPSRIAGQPQNLTGPQITPGGLRNQARLGGEPAATPENIGAKTAAENRARADVEYGDLLNPRALRPGPGTTEPVFTDRGTVLPPVSDQATLPRSPAEAKGAVESWQKTKDNWNAAVAPSYEAEQRLNTIAKAFKSFQTGAYATHKAEIAAALKSVGITPPAGMDPQAVQLALHENYIETIQALKASGTRWTQMEFKALSANREHPNLQPEANLQMLSEDIGTLRHARDLATDFNEAQKNGWRDPNSFQAAWMYHNPLKAYVARAKQEIGPLKGMDTFESRWGGARDFGSGGAPAGSAPASAAPVQVRTPVDAHNLPPGTRYITPDGRRYVR
jgi:hypothetical protein